MDALQHVEAEVNFFNENCFILFQVWLKYPQRPI